MATIFESLQDNLKWKSYSFWPFQTGLNINKPGGFVKVVYGKNFESGRSNHHLGLINICSLDSKEISAAGFPKELVVQTILYVAGREMLLT